MFFLVNYCLMKNKKSAQNIQFQNLVHEKTFRLSSHTSLGHLLTYFSGQTNKLYTSLYDHQQQTSKSKFTLKIHSDLTHISFYIICINLTLLKHFMSQSAAIFCITYMQKLACFFFIRNSNLSFLFSAGKFHNLPQFINSYIF